MGLRALSLFFAWYAITCTVGAFATAQTSPVMAGALAAFALASGATASGLKRRRAWATTALALTALAGIGVCLAVLVFVGQPQRTAAAGPILAGGMLWAAFCAAATRYARGRLVPAG